MDKMRRSQIEGIKDAPVASVVESPIPEAREASPLKTSNRAAENEKRIREIKEELRLDRGEVIIKPLEGDPFVLSRNHVSTGEGVTIYKPDGTVQKETLAEYKARLAQGRVAANYVKQSRELHSETQKISVRRLLSTGTNWLGALFGGLFRKLMTSFRN